MLWLLGSWLLGREQQPLWIDSEAACATHDHVPAASTQLVFARRQIATIDCFRHDEFRPELFWRSFKTRTGYNPDTDIIHIFKRESGTN
jgi:hypothetical protein